MPNHWVELEVVRLTDEGLRYVEDVRAGRLKTYGQDVEFTAENADASIDIFWRNGEVVVVGWLWMRTGEGRLIRELGPRKEFRGLFKLGAYRHWRFWVELLWPGDESIARSSR